jgi:hypothetical protein
LLKVIKTKKYFTNILTTTITLIRFGRYPIEMGVWPKKFEEKEEATRIYFSSLFKESVCCPIEELLEVLKLFTNVLSVDMNELLEDEVKKNELELTLFSMKKGKIPSPNNFSMEFYIRFYDLFKYDLLKMVQEYKEP